MDAIFIIDIVYVLAASTCGGFLMYGGWLCLVGSEEKAPQREELANSITGKPLLS